ncbi:hypothetical protein A5739_11360 [Mycobacterium colombiense]|uniref:hypothetical protein n=1 Tax=Mycobacterium colombiense TaxID=339268 RepID=UPI00096F4E86|nr:hypothetical protein [Mycobacterium colombiense]OMC32010.1 hypothetical protein A5739_11360 [Mycobacterium colombiense]
MTNRVKETEWETVIIAAHLWANNNQWPTTEQFAELRAVLDPARSQESIEPRVWLMQTAFGCERGPGGTSKLDYDTAELFRLKPNVMTALAEKLRELLAAQ